MGDKLRIFSGNSNEKLAKDINKELNLKPGDSEVTNFSDGEISVKINESVRDNDVFVIQSTNPPNDNLIELLIMLDGLKRASANRITAVLPYFGYARQEKKMKPRDPISAKLVADIITRAGADRVLTIDLHAAQIQGFFDIPVDNLTAALILSNYIKKKKLKDMVIVSPDLGGVKRAREFAKKLNAPIAIIDKRRPKENESEVMNIIGDIKDKTAIRFDDMGDTAGTLVNAAQALIDKGAKEVYACCTHAVLSGPAIERIKKSIIKELVVTDTIPLKINEEKIKQLSVAKLLANAIKRIHDGDSVSVLFED
jgi:ribose-phosphate pyrophosphokinase